jgi:hypothetical protein
MEFCDCRLAGYDQSMSSYVVSFEKVFDMLVLGDFDGPPFLTTEIRGCGKRQKENCCEADN